MTREEFQVVFDKHRAGSGNGNGPRNPGNRPNPPPGVRPEPREQDGLPPVLRFLDTNDDRRLTRAELGRILQAFDRLDSNQDGLLDAAELEAAGQEPSDSNPTAGPQRPPGGSPPARNAAGNPQENPTRTPAVPEASGPGTSSRTGPDSAASRLRGVWSGWVVRGRGENPNEGEMEIELTVEGNRIVGRELGTRRGPPNGLGAGTFTMTGDGRTGNLDTVGTSGSQDGRNSMGIYELDGDTLKWCVTQRNRQRPRTMESDRGNYLLVLRKQASQK